MVVCVDDDPKVLASLTRLLRREPYRLFGTSDPLEALERARRQKVDLLITDERMTRASGGGLLRAVRLLSPGMMVIILTGYPSLATERSRAARPAHPWLAAPDLRRTIRELLHARPTGTFTG